MHLENVNRLPTGCRTGWNQLIHPPKFNIDTKNYASECISLQIWHRFGEKIYLKSEAGSIGMRSTGTPPRMPSLVAFIPWAPKSILKSFKPNGKTPQCLSSYYIRGFWSPSLSLKNPRSEGLISLGKRGIEMFAIIFPLQNKWPPGALALLSSGTSNRAW